MELAVLPLQHDQDLVAARQQASAIAELLGFESQDPSEARAGVVWRSSQASWRRTSRSTRAAAG